MPANFQATNKLAGIAIILERLAAGPYDGYPGPPHQTSARQMIDPHDTQPKPQRMVIAGDDWFDVVKVSESLFAISEPRHYEHTVIYLLIGNERAVLIDTGCGIGNLRRVVEQLTTFPITVVNTHAHLDHLGSNHQFSEILMFDHARGRGIATDGAPHDVLLWELMREEIVTPPWPRGFRREEAALPPFHVSRWVKDGEVLKVGNIGLKVLHTPGEAPDHVCLLDQAHRVLFSGDILLNGAVWSHLDGGDIGQLHASYELLMRHYDEFDILMPSHNGPSQDKDLLPIALAATEDILSGRARPQAGVDPWGRHYNKYDFGRISILAK
jgi:glyoxylase-like metal-dependent hydrolase (beta-lactamase superfamily II)